MKDKVVYLTQYHKDHTTLQEEVLEDYTRKCQICNTTENLTNNKHTTRRDIHRTIQ